MCKYCSKYNLGDSYYVEHPGFIADTIIFTHCPSCGRKLKLKSEKKQHVYCGDCEHYSDDGSWTVMGRGTDSEIWRPAGECLHPENKTKNWHSEDGGVIETPMQINKDNDCPWYENKNGSYY